MKPAPAEWSGPPELGSLMGSDGLKEPSWSLGWEDGAQKEE